MCEVVVVVELSDLGVSLKEVAGKENMGSQSYLEEMPFKCCENSGVSRLD